MRRDVEEDCWYVQPRDELRPAASLTVVGHIIVLFRRPFLSRTPFPDSPVCHDTLAWVLGTGGLHAGKYTVDISMGNVGHSHRA